MSNEENNCAQREYAPHQQRVIDERNELVNKAQKLSGFVGTDIYNRLSINEQNLLKMQNRVMDQYIEILNMRIATF